MMSALKSFILTCVVIGGGALETEVQAAEITVTANCGVSAVVPGGAYHNLCEGMAGIHPAGEIYQGEKVEFPSHSTKAAYFVTVADFGHVGAMTSVFAFRDATVIDGNGFGEATTTEATVQIATRDSFVLTSSSLQYGSPVQVQVAYRLHGDIGVNRGGPTVQNAFSKIDGYISIDYVNTGPVAPYFSPFGLDTLNMPTLQPRQFEIKDSEYITLQVGVPYVFTSTMSLLSMASLNFFQVACESNLCQAASYVDSSQSLFTYLTPESPTVELVSGSGHNYSIPTVPEPSVQLLMAMGLVVVLSCRLFVVRRAEARWSTGLAKGRALDVWHAVEKSTLCQRFRNSKQAMKFSATALR